MQLRPSSGNGGAFETARADFVAAGAEETETTQWLANPATLGIHGPKGQQLRECATAILDSLKAKAVPLAGLLEQETTYIRYRVDYHGARPLPTEGLAKLIWDAVLAYDNVPSSLKLQAPEPKRHIELRVAANPGRYGGL